MCHESCIVFVAQRLPPAEVSGRSIIELGAAGASVRPLLEHWHPSRYVGVDLFPGLGVDEVCRVEEAVDRFGAGSFDIVLTTEMLEHVRDWRAAIHSIKRLCRPGGRIVLTTRSLGFPFHDAPSDYWRFEADDMHAIFADCAVDAIEPDRQKPGIFVSVRTVPGAPEADLTKIALYAMPLRRRALTIRDEDLRGLGYARVRADFELRRVLSRVTGLYLDRMGRK